MNICSERESDTSFHSAIDCHRLILMVDLWNGDQTQQRSIVMHPGARQDQYALFTHTSSRQPSVSHGYSESQTSPYARGPNARASSTASQPPASWQGGGPPSEWSSYSEYLTIVTLCMGCVQEADRNSNSSSALRTRLVVILSSSRVRRTPTRSMASVARTAATVCLASPIWSPGRLASGSIGLDVSPAATTGPAAVAPRLSRLDAGRYSNPDSSRY